MTTSETLDDPRQRSFSFLKLLADDLSRGEVSFPTFSGATVRIRNALSDDGINAGKLARIVSSEPLLSAKLLHTANSAALNAGGRPISDVKTAVLRVGYATVKTLAVAIAMEQLQAGSQSNAVRKHSERVWRHSLDVAAISFVIAGKLTKLSADEAMFAGLVHDIGKFYLLARASSHPELVADEAELEAILKDWHASMGNAVLSALDVPDAVLKAVNDHEQELYTMPPRSLSDVVVLANMAAHARDPDDSDAPPNEPALAQLVKESDAEIRGLVAALRA